MGLLDLIKPKSALEKNAKAIREPYSQPEYRREAMQKLLEMESEEAYDAVLMRFTFNSHGGIADEDEKNELVEELVKIGRPALPALTRFIQREKQIAFPVRAYSRIVEKEELLEFLVASLRKYEPLDHRSTQAKATLISSIHDYGTPAQAMAVVPYLEDHHDDVQFQAIAALERFKDPASRDALANVCVEGSHSARIQSRAAQVICDLEWAVKDLYDKMSPEVKSEFLLSKKGTLVRKHAKPAST